MKLSIHKINNWWLWIRKNNCIAYLIKEPYKTKSKFLINKQYKVGLKRYNDPEAFIQFSNDMQDVLKNIDEYNSGKKRQQLIVFGDMITDIISNTKLNTNITELFIRGRKLNIFNNILKY